MKFGKTDLKPEEIDFTIPEFEEPRWDLNKEGDATLNAGIAKAGDSAKKSTRNEGDSTSTAIQRAAGVMVYTGQPVWSAKGNIGKIYPKGTRPNKFLYHYSRQFNSIELNATYYKIPSADQVKNWSAETPEDFKFCPKFPQFISHRKKLSEKSAALDEFLTNIYGFDEKLGISFLQLPPHFSTESIDELVKFMDLLPRDMDFAIEFRHESWFKDEEAWSTILEDMHKKNIATVVSDTPGRRDVLHLDLSNSNLIVRFKGNNLHESDYTRIAQWTDRCNEMIKSGLKNLYFFLHQEDESMGIELAQIFTKNMNQNFDKKFRYPQLIGQSDLFA